MTDNTNETPVTPTNPNQPADNPAGDEKDNGSKNGQL